MARRFRMNFEMVNAAFDEGAAGKPPMSRARLVSHIAGCHDCSAEVDARNAMGWAHQHNYRTGHHVWVELRYSIQGPAVNPPKEKRRGR